MSGEAARKATPIPPKVTPIIERYEEGNHCYVIKSGGISSTMKMQLMADRDGVQKGEMVKRKYPESAAETGGLELSHCFNYGNWRRMKSMCTRSARGNTVDVWKCMDCGVKLQKVYKADSGE